MLLDPFTIIAQIVNFVILVYALKHFLYDRVLEAMDAREATLAERLHAAERREAEADDRVTDYDRRRTELEGRAKELLDEARGDADRHRKELVHEARADIDALRERWEQALVAEQRDIAHELRRKTAREVVELSRGALSDLADVELEAVALDRGLNRLQRDQASLSDLFDDLGPDVPLVVRTGFELGAPASAAVHERLIGLGLDPKHEVRFDVDDHLILGIELDGNGTAVSWHADDYLDRLDASVKRMLDDGQSGFGTDGDG